MGELTLGKLHVLSMKWEYYNNKAKYFAQVAEGDKYAFDFSQAQAEACRIRKEFEKLIEEEAQAAKGSV